MKILIAEDDPVLRERLQGLLKLWGCEVIAAPDCIAGPAAEGGRTDEPSPPQSRSYRDGL